MSAALQQAVEELGHAFEAFKAENDKRLKAIEEHGHAPADLEQKVSELSATITNLQQVKDRLDHLEAVANRPTFGGSAEIEKAKAEHSQAFSAYFRKGREDGLRDLEIQAALTTQSDPDGGFIVPEEVDTEISRVLGAETAMRMLATVRVVGSATYKKIVNVGGASSGWVGEEESRGETNTPQLKELDYPAMELFAEPRATQSMLDDGSLDIAEWLADEVSIEFSEQEGNAFITGNGVKKPRGILSYPAVANASYSWGNLGYIASGAAGAFAASNPSDKLIDLVHALRRGYRRNAAFLMNDLTLAEARKFKDANGNYIWRAGLEAGAPETLLGKPVEVDDYMPDVAANSLSIVFGDFRRGYVITDRMGTRVLRDPYTNKPYVKFYTTKRVGGGVQNFEAIKVMKFAAS